MGTAGCNFCLLTLAAAAASAIEAPSSSFFATIAEDLDDPERRFTLTAEDIALLNPNTRTCPVFRTRRDAELTKAIYRRVPVLVREGDPDGNPWGVKFSTMFHMSNDSHLFRTRDAARGRRLRARRQRVRPRRRALAAAVRGEDAPPLRPPLGDYAMRPTASHDTQLPDVPTRG